MRSHGFRELWFRHQLDAVATIRVSASRVRFEKDRAEWDGVRQKIQKKGGGSFSGNVFVSSVAFAVFDDTDAMLYSNRGGLELLMRREKDQLVPIEAENYFQDEKPSANQYKHSHDKESDDVSPSEPFPVIAVGSHLTKSPRLEFKPTLLVT